jgi:hypothetical protein
MESKSYIYIQTLNIASQTHQYCNTYPEITLHFILFQPSGDMSSSNSLQNCTFVSWNGWNSIPWPTIKLYLYPVNWAICHNQIINVPWQNGQTTLVSHWRLLQISSHSFHMWVTFPEQHIKLNITLGREALARCLNNALIVHLPHGNIS